MCIFFFHLQKSPLNKLVNLLLILFYPTQKPKAKTLRSTLGYGSSIPKIHFYTHTFFKNGRRFMEVFLGTWKKGKMFKSTKGSQIFPNFYSAEGSRKWFPAKLRNFEQFKVCLLHILIYTSLLYILYIILPSFFSSLPASVRDTRVWLALLIPLPYHVFLCFIIPIFSVPQKFRCVSS